MCFISTYFNDVEGLDLHVTTPMCKSLLEIIWVIRYHQDIQVRHSCVLALTQILITISKQPTTINEYELKEFQLWLLELQQFEQNESLLLLSQNCLLMFNLKEDVTV